MADHLSLYYLIEGTQRPSYIFVPYVTGNHPTMVDTLRRMIFDDCKDLTPALAPAPMYLTLLKVNVDPNLLGTRLPLLRLDTAGNSSLIPLFEYDRGIKSLEPWETISSLWGEQPNLAQLHIFVTFSDLPEEFEAPQKALESAHLMYDRFWAKKNLNQVLQPVPGRSDFKYMTKQQIDSLSVKKYLLYCEDVLLVLKEYEVAYTALKSLKDNDNKLVKKGAGVVVTGQPGIGKTCFLYYLLFCLLSEGETVAFQLDKDYFILFQETGIRMVKSTPFTALPIPPGTWALADSSARSVDPCEVFWDASKAGNAWVVLTTAPPPKRWEAWHNNGIAEIYCHYWMDVISLDELIILGTILHYDLKSLRDSYALWGPSTRNCLAFTVPSRVLNYQRAVTSAVGRFTENPNQFKSLDAVSASHQLFVVRPSIGSRYDFTVEFASNHILGLVSRAYAQHDHAMRLEFYKVVSRHAWFSALAGHIFETHVLLWLRYAPAQLRLSCTRAVGTSPLLDIPVCGKNMEFFSKVEDLKKVDVLNESPKCLVPVAQNFPTIDAIVVTKKFVISIQITISATHDAKNIGFEKVYNHLPSELRDSDNRRWCHVFLTDSEDKAESLRRQKLTDLPQKMKIHVYSALFNVNLWGSILTPERVLELDKIKEQARQKEQEEGTAMVISE